MDLLRIRTTSDYSIGHNHTIASHGYHNTSSSGSITAAAADYKTEPQSVDSPPSEMYNTSPSSTTSSSSSILSSSATSNSSSGTTTTVSVKQEPNNNTTAATTTTQHRGGAHFLIKTELPDPHFNDSQNTTNFKVRALNFTPSIYRLTNYIELCGATYFLEPHSYRRYLTR